MTCIQSVDFRASFCPHPLRPSDNPSARMRSGEETMGRLEWNRSVERDRNVLERILALLLALAALVDRAAG